MPRISPPARAIAPRPLSWRVGTYLPFIVLVPSLFASFIYVFVFSAWTFYISLSNSSLLPSYGWKGFENYVSLWSNRRWNIAYTNLFYFSAFYVIGSMAVGLLLAILIDQRVRGESIWRTIFLYPLAVSFIVTGTVWSWLYDPTAGIQHFVRALGFESFTFALTTDRQLAIYAIIITGIWQSSGFAMALFLAINTSGVAVLPASYTQPSGLLTGWKTLSGPPAAMHAKS